MKLHVVHVEHRESDQIGRELGERGLERLGAETTIPDAAAMAGGVQRARQIGESERINRIGLIVAVGVDEQHADDRRQTRGRRR